MLVRLVYASRATAALDADALQDILRSARERNPAEGITGLLWNDDGVFIQVLEGGREAVNARYRRIVMDARHDQIMLLSYDDIAERRFAGWAMGQVNLHRLNPALLLKYGETQRLDPYRMTGQALTALFEELVGSGAIDSASGSLTNGAALRGCAPR